MRDQFKAGRVELENAIAYWVNRFYQASRREMYRAFHAEGYDFTPEQWMVLVRLSERDGRRQNDLCDATTRDASTMSRILDTMSKHGLVRRVPDPEDGRSRIIVLTPAGRAASKKLVPVAQALVERFEEGISESDLEITRRTLRRLAEKLD